MAVVSNVEVYGLENAFRVSKFPMSTDIEQLNDNYTDTIKRLAMSNIGEGHDNFLCGIVVQFDLTFTVKAWTEAERYHFFDIISSQSTMHRITKFDLDKAYCKYVDKRIISILKEKIDRYNKLNALNNIAELPSEYKTELQELYLEILYSNPCGFKLTAGITTNYRQLKTIYKQRKNHRLPEWREFCEWIKTLPYSEFVTGEFKDETEVDGSST